MEFPAIVHNQAAGQAAGAAQNATRRPRRTCRPGATRCPRRGARRLRPAPRTTPRPGAIACCRRHRGEGILDLLSFARGPVQHEFFGVVSSVALLCHENLPFRGLLQMRSISSLPNTEQLFSCPIFLFTELPRKGIPGNPASGV